MLYSYKDVYFDVFKNKSIAFKAGSCVPLDVGDTIKMVSRFDFFKYVKTYKRLKSIYSETVEAYKINIASVAYSCEHFPWGMKLLSYKINSKDGTYYIEMEVEVREVFNHGN